MDSSYEPSFGLRSVGPGRSPVTGPIESKDSSVQFVLSGSISVDLD